MMDDLRERLQRSRERRAVLRQQVHAARQRLQEITQEIRTGRHFERDAVMLEAVIEPPDRHPNYVSGERLPVTIIIPGPYPWHEPWEGWTITEVISRTKS